jgi:hypothetical protein
MMPWPKRSSKSANVALTVLGTITSPLIARRPITSARSWHPAGAESPATTASSGTKCRTPVLTEAAAATPTATISHANATLATSLRKNARLNMTTITQDATTSVKGNLAARGLPCARQSLKSSWTSLRMRALPMPLAPLHRPMTTSPATTRDPISAWKRSFEGRVVISSISSTERGEVFYGPTDWLGSRDPMTHIRCTRGSSTGLAD